MVVVGDPGNMVVGGQLLTHSFFPQYYVDLNLA